jgi:hypothetical protein
MGPASQYEHAVKSSNNLESSWVMKKVVYSTCTGKIMKYESRRAVKCCKSRLKAERRCWKD